MGHHLLKNGAILDSVNYQWHRCLLWVWLLFRQGVSTISKAIIFRQALSIFSFSSCKWLSFERLLLTWMCAMEYMVYTTVGCPRIGWNKKMFQNMSARILSHYLGSRELPTKNQLDRTWFTLPPKPLLYTKIFKGFSKFIKEKYFHQ